MPSQLRLRVRDIITERDGKTAKERNGGGHTDRSVDKTMKHLGHINRSCYKYREPRLKDLNKIKGRTNIWTDERKWKSSY